MKYTEYTKDNIHEIIGLYLNTSPRTSIPCYYKVVQINKITSVLTWTRADPKSQGEFSLDGVIKLLNTNEWIVGNFISEVNDSYVLF